MDEARRTIGRYTVVRRIGSGGMAVVYLARHTDLDRNVALKELREFRDADPALVARFVRESRLIARLNHPSIVTVHDFYEYEGIPYIVMEYVPRGSLRPLVGRLTTAQTFGVLEGLLAALAHAESLGVVHRDVKPENVLVTDDGRVKLTDFGIAKYSDATTRFRTRTGQAMGTPIYMSPEQATGDSAIGPASDLYSLGVMAFEMFVGHPPFDAATDLGVLWQHVNTPLPSRLSTRPELSPAVAGWLERMLAKSPESRPDSAEAAWRELEDVADEALGSRWRRQARLLETDPGEPGARPLTPAPFAEGAPPEDDFLTYGREREPERESEPGPLAGVPAAGREEPTLLPADPAAASGVPPVDEEPSPPHPEIDLAGSATVAPSRSQPEPEPEPERDAAPTIRRRRFAAAGVGAACVAAAGLGFALHGDGEDPTPRGAVRFASSNLALELPAGFARARAEEAAPGLDDLADRVTLAAPGAANERAVIFGMAGAEAANPMLLSARAVQALGADRSRRRAVELGPGLQAYQYRGLKSSSRAAAVFVAPTTRGVATVACLTSPADASAFEPRCEETVKSLRLVDARPYAVAPSPGYARRIRAVLGELRAAVTAQQATVRAARRPGTARDTLEALADAYTRAAAVLKPLTLSPADQAANAGLVRALQATAAASRRAARAAGTQRRGGYASASKAVRTGRARIVSALADLRESGYSV